LKKNRNQKEAKIVQERGEKGGTAGERKRESGKKLLSLKWGDSLRSTGGKAKVKKGASSGKRRESTKPAFLKLAYLNFLSRGGRRKPLKRISRGEKGAALPQVEKITAISM